MTIPSISVPDHMEIINYRESNYQNVLDSRERLNHHSKSLLTGRSISEYQKKILKYFPSNSRIYFSSQCIHDVYFKNKK